MTVWQRIIMFVCGVFFTWLMITGFLWILSEGMYWSVRHGVGAGAIVIIGGAANGLLVAIGFITCGYALFGDYEKPKSSEPTDDTGRLLTKAEVDVMAERQRQIYKELWTTAHDDKYKDNELSRAAACYALGVTAYWPLKWQGWWKPTSRRRDLVKAGALILAEIERLDRLAVPIEELQQ